MAMVLTLRYLAVDSNVLYRDTYLALKLMLHIRVSVI